MHLTNQLTDHNQKTLLYIARQSIINGLTKAQPIKVQAQDFAKQLAEKRASFVTLKKNQQLRGCIGMLEATRPLIEDVAGNAFAAAFRDSRFDSVSTDEINEISIQISILSKPEPIEFTTEKELLGKLQPNIDGLILTKGVQRGTFLPSVWESLPNPKDFLDQLKLKAHIDKDEWTEQIKILRYQTEIIEENSC